MGADSSECLNTKYVSLEGTQPRAAQQLLLGAVIPIAKPSV